MRPRATLNSIPWASGLHDRYRWTGGGRADDGNSSSTWQATWESWMAPDSGKHQETPFLVAIWAAMRQGYWHS